ncbi:sensor histidine kinase [Micromonospora foliorum]|uniref:sensor histidine kinase n=1 Tax=Micromonospora foliorum TaxID=2911210 RepID=UPI001EE9863F|nr:histidine kinase [Micromonospora foliorum]MCG5438368.1 histidine kinase [Micromonospora foliorum]
MTSLAVPEHPWLLPGALAGAVSPEAAARRPRRTTRDWAVDTLAFLISLLWVLFATADALSPDPAITTPLPHDWMTGVDALIGLVCCGLLWLRRRWPLGLMVATTPLTLFSMASAIPLVILYFTVVVHRRTAVAVAVTGVGLVTNMVFSWLRPDPNMSYWVTASWGVVISLAVLAWGMFVRARRQLIVSLRDRAERAEAEQQLRVAQARHLERTRIAREMHDVLAHAVSLMIVQAEAGPVAVRTAPDRAEAAFDAIAAAGRDAMVQLRGMLGLLRSEPGPRSPQPTLAQLRTLVDGVPVAGLRVTGEPRPVSADVELAAYRIVQEALTNAVKHAAASTVDVHLDWSPEALTVTVTDDGAGTGGPGGGHGLVGIRERATACGGTARAEAVVGGRGFTVEARLPFPA